MTATDARDSIHFIKRELLGVVGLLEENASDAIWHVAELISGSPRVFLLGAGRSGLALQMVAMRFMHLGLEAHVVGEVTAPAIAGGDLLIVASGSGTTPGIVRAVATAGEVGATIAVITANPDSDLARTAGPAAIIVSAAGKLDRSETKSAQYAGSLFEQTVVIVGDSIFDALWRRSGVSADALWARHSNLE